MAHQAVDRLALLDGQRRARDPAPMACITSSPSALIPWTGEPTARSSSGSASSSVQSAWSLDGASGISRANEASTCCARRLTSSSNVGVAAVRLATTRMRSRGFHGDLLGCRVKRELDFLTRLDRRPASPLQRPSADLALVGQGLRRGPLGPLLKRGRWLIGVAALVLRGRLSGRNGLIGAGLSGPREARGFAVGDLEELPRDHAQVLEQAPAFPPDGLGIAVQLCVVLHRACKPARVARWLLAQPDRRVGRPAGAQSRPRPRRPGRAC